MLKKNPAERISIDNLQIHPWITNNGQHSCDWRNDVEYVEQVEISDDDIGKAMTNL